MANWIDTVVVLIVVAGGLFVLYKPLKEPLDKFFGLIKKLFLSLSNRAKGAQQSAEEMIVEYG